MPLAAHEQIPNTASSAPPVRRLIALVLYIAPLGYAGALIGLAVHEVVGHGLVALLVGGDFRGFTLRPNITGLARAWPDRDAPLWREVAVLAGGVTATTLIGAALLAAAFGVRRRPFARIALASLASCFVLNGSLYMLWNAYHPQPPGDIGRIVQATGSQTLRWAIFALGAAMTATFLIVPMAIVVRAGNRWLRAGSVCRAWHLAILPSLIGIGFAVGQFVFDWNYIARGIGRVPNSCGIIFGLAAAIVLLRVPADARPLPDASAFPWLPLAAVWVSTVALAATVAFWLQRGVAW